MLIFDAGISLIIDLEILITGVCITLWLRELYGIVV